MLIRNVSGQLLRDGEGAEWSAGEVREMDITVDLAKYRESLGIYKMLEQKEPEIPKPAKAAAPKQTKPKTTRRRKPKVTPGPTLEEMMT